MKAFVAGATGLTGRTVVQSLLAKDIETIAHVRPDSSRLAQWRTRFTDEGALVDTTEWELSALAATMRRLRPDIVFALLGTTRKRARAASRQGEDAGYEAVDYGLSVMLMDACRDLDCRFVYLSSIGVGPNAAGAYLKVRWRAEEHLRASGLSWTIARPSTIIGDRDEDRPAERVAATVLDGAMSLAGLLGAKKLKDRYRSNTGPQLGEALVRLSLDPTWANRLADGAALHVSGN